MSTTQLQILSYFGFAVIVRCSYILLNIGHFQTIPDKTHQVKLEIYLSELELGMYLITQETSGFN